MASVITPKGTSAIASIHVLGPEAESIVRSIFRSRSNKPVNFDPGKILSGSIVKGEQIIDDVVIGCEGEGSFVINCHGNAIIIEMIMTLLQEKGASAVAPERIVSNQFADSNSIAKEVRIEQARAVTPEGVRIVNRQLQHGLGKIAETWLDGMDNIALNEIRAGCREILRASRHVRPFITGCKVVIAGAPNSGKSTLLNHFCGKEKAIVAAHAGTTRDWVSARCRINGLAVEFFDTAGLESGATCQSSADRQAQRKSIELIENCDLVLGVVDSSDISECNWYEQIAVCGVKLLVVLNKSDLKPDAGAGCLGFDADGVIYISAKLGEGTDELAAKIYELLTEVTIGKSQAVCFTERQAGIVGHLAEVSTREEAKSLLTELLNGQVCV